MRKVFNYAESTRTRRTAFPGGTAGREGRRCWGIETRCGRTCWPSGRTTGPITSPPTPSGSPRKSAQRQSPPCGGWRPSWRAARRWKRRCCSTGCSPATSPTTTARIAARRGTASTSPLISTEPSPERPSVPASRSSIAWHWWPRGWMPVVQRRSHLGPGGLRQAGAAEILPPERRLDGGTRALLPAGALSRRPGGAGPDAPENGGTGLSNERSR